MPWHGPRSCGPSRHLDSSAVLPGLRERVGEGPSASVPGKPGADRSRALGHRRRLVLGDSLREQLFAVSASLPDLDVKQLLRDAERRAARAPEA